MAQFAREKIHSRIPQKKNEQSTSQPGHQHIEAHIILLKASRTHHAASTTPKHSLKEAPRFLEDALRGCPRQTASRVPERRKFCSLLRTRNRQQTIFEIRRPVSRSLETDDLWLTYKRNAPHTRHPRQRHRCGRLSRLYFFFFVSSGGWGKINL